jgi:hypothetical protein
MPHYYSLGTVPHKRHTQFRREDGSLYSEQLFSTEGFSNDYSLLYHCHPPTEIIGTDEPFDIQPRVAEERMLKHRSFEGFRIPPVEDYLKSRKPVLVNSDCHIVLAALTPEKLDGVEAGWGGDTKLVRWSVTGFWNGLHDAVESATIPLSNCPPGTGTCQQRKNVGTIDASGLEADIAENISDTLSLRQAVSWTDARVHPGAADPLITGKRPAQAPTAVATGGIVWKPLTPLSLESDLRWVSSQYEDDLNSIKLGSALVVDLRADWQVRTDISIFGRIGNVLDAKVATGNTTGVINTGEPRIFEIGVSYAD